MSQKARCPPVTMSTAGARNSRPASPGCWHSIDQSPAAMRSPGRRRLVLAVGGVGAMFLLPWLVFLSATLPATSSGGAWRTVWVGFDVALVAAFVATV